MVRIRLAVSTKNKHVCDYFIVVSDTRNRRDGNFIEKIGHYHPYYSDEKRCVLDIDKIEKWIGVGADMTDRVAFLVRKSVLSSNYIPSERLAKIIQNK